MGFSDHVQPNISVRRGIIRGISIHGIHTREMLFFLFSVCTRKAIFLLCNKGKCTKGAPKIYK